MCIRDRSASTLTVNSGKTLTVSKDGQLTVAGAVSNSGTILVVSDENESGSLIATSASTFTLSYDLYIPATQWKLVGIPVSGVTIGDIDDNLATNTVGGVSKVGIGYYDSESAAWSVYAASSTGTSLAQTKGYEMIHSSGDVVRFSGSLRTGSRGTIATYNNK